MITKQVTDKSMPQRKFLTLVVNSAIGLIALLMFIAGMYPSTVNWGVNHLAFYPSTVRFMVPLLILLLLIPSVRRLLMKHLERYVAYFGKQKKPIRLLYAIIVLAASGVVFWSARTATHFLGDGYVLLRNVGKEMGSKEFFLNPWNREPLTIFLVFKLHKLFSALGIVDSAESAFRAYSIFCGITFIAIIWKLKNLISKEHVERVLLFLFLFASGASQLFFGYVENYTLAYTMVFLFITVSISYLQGTTSITFPVIIFPLMVATYFATIIFLPALLMLMWVSIRRKEIQATVLASLGALLLAVGLMWMLDYTPDFISKVLGGAKNLILPFTKISKNYQAYTFFSVGHVIDLLNLLFLIQPTAVILLFTSGWLVRKQENRIVEKVFLLLMMLCGIAFICAVNSEIGMSRDWDALAVFSGGISVAAIYGWFYETNKSLIRRELFAAITVVALLQTGLWIGINANETSALQRMDILQEDSRWSEFAIHYNAETRGNLCWSRNEFADAAKWYERLVALEPSHYYLSRLGSIYIKMRDYPKSFKIYKWMDSLGYADVEAYSNLGMIYMDAQRYDDALKYFYKAESLDSTLSDTPLNIGVVISMRSNAYDKALPYFLKAIKLDPSNVQAYYNASRCYQLLGDMVMAQKYYERYSELSRTQQKRY